MSNICEICGNQRGVDALRCRFCGAKLTESDEVRAHQQPHRVINLEIGMPTVDVALEKLDRELERAFLDKVMVVTVIHGYGSSGKGGKIKKESRVLLEYYRTKGKVRRIIWGEDFSKKNGSTKSLLRRIPEMAKNDNLNRGNRGITVLEL